MNSKYDDKKLIAELAQNDDITIEEFLKKRNLTEHRNFLARHIKSERFPFLTYGYYLEKVLFPRDGIAKPGTGYFEMGCRQKEDPSPEKLIHEIIETIILPLNPNPDKPELKFFHFARDFVIKRLMFQFQQTPLKNFILSYTINFLIRQKEADCLASLLKYPI